VLVALLTYGLQARLDKPVYVCATNPAQPTYANAWDDARREEFVGPGTAKAKEPGYLAGSHQVFSSFFRLRILGHKRTSVAVSLPRTLDVGVAGLRVRPG
jgi:hypothetical protein